MKNSIGKKVISMMVLMGVMTLLICLLNVSALSVIEEQNQKIAQDVKELQAAMENSDTGSIERMQEDINYMLSRSANRVGGTYLFNIVLVVLTVINVIILVIFANRSLAKPAKCAGHQLTEIVEGIQRQKGDLTQRIEVKTNDEIGQLVGGINNFIATLQTLMIKMQEQSARMMDSAEAVIREVSESNQSAMNVSAAT